MNYLAHAYLSFNIPDIIVGNMISDFVKGRKKFDYSDGIQKGIHLHRLIDEFTDQHPVTRKAKLIFKPVYGLYSGAFVDVAYDHYLANDKNIFPAMSNLANFTSHIYLTLDNARPVLPDFFIKLFPHMKQHDWLFNYSTLAGMKHSFEGLVRRAKYLDNSDSAYRLMIENFSQLQDCYDHFFPEITEYVIHQLEKMNVAN